MAENGAGDGPDATEKKIIRQIEVWLTSWEGHQSFTENFPSKTIHLHS